MSRVGVTRRIYALARVRVYGGVERRDDPSRESVHPILWKRSLEPIRPSSSLSLSLPQPLPPPPHARWPRAVSPDIMVHTRIRGITRLPPSPLYALSRSTFYCSLPIEHCAIATVIIPRCKRHNLVTVSPGISFSNDTAFIMREVRRPRSFPRIIIDRYRQS